MARSRRGGGGAGAGAGGVKVTPNLLSDPEGTRALNLSVLRRLDPAVTDILITASHVVSYSFDYVIQVWVRTVPPYQNPCALPSDFLKWQF